MSAGIDATAMFIAGLAAIVLAACWIERRFGE